MKIKGHFFEPLSSGNQPSVLLVEHGEIRIDRNDGATIRNLHIESIQGPDNIHFKCGSYFQSEESLPAEFKRQFRSRLQRTISWLEKFTFSKAIVITLLLITAIVAYRFAFSTIGSGIAVLFPDRWEEAIGTNSYQSVQLFALSESGVPVDYQDEIRLRAQDIAQKAELSRPTEIIFHDSDWFGPNAFAFPGGPIVVTDELVELLSNDEELLAVIAHEFAHVEDRHSLKQVIEIIGISALAYLLFGADDSVIEEISAVLINGWAFKNSRNFEQEADLAALQYLQASDIDQLHFVNAITKLTNYMCGLASDSPLSCNDDVVNWISTHPSGTQRIEYLINEIR